MLAALDGGQWLDWVRYDRQFKVALNRDDLLWAMARAEFINCHLDRGEMPVTWQQCDPYRDPLEGLEEELSREQLLGKIGIGKRFGKKQDAT